MIRNRNKIETKYDEKRGEQSDENQKQNNNNKKIFTR